jgi:hypothetical protein
MGRVLRIRAIAILAFCCVLRHARRLVLSWEPRAFLFTDFLSQTETDALIQLGKNRTRRSQVYTEAGKQTWSGCMLSLTLWTFHQAD